MENYIKLQLNNTDIINVELWKFHIIRCNNISCFEVLQYPEEFKTSSIFYSFPSSLDGFFHINSQEIFDMKIKSGNDMGSVIINSIEENLKKGFTSFLVNPAGVDIKGIEFILKYMEEKSNSFYEKISFVLILNHLDYHAYFEDDSILSNSIRKRKSIFSMKISS